MKDLITRFDDFKNIQSQVRLENSIKDARRNQAKMTQQCAMRQCDWKNSELCDDTVS